MSARIGLLALFIFGSSASFAATHPLLSLSLEQLFEVEVTSVGRKPELLAEVASAVYVISSEDIRRSTAAYVPELLKMAPGVDVRRIDASHWAVGIRGFNGEFSNKLLVLLDGVSVYTPTFSGVNWDELDIDLAEIERIEIVRGPGAASWGANAVNGVINIITRSAVASSGSRASLLYGDNLRPAAGLAHGGQIGDALSYRVSGFFRKNGNSDGRTDSRDRAADDKWYSRRLEFRSDLNLSGNDKLSLIARGWSNDRRQISDVFSPVPPIRTLQTGGADSHGGTALLKMQQVYDWGNRQWQLYYDDRSRDELRYETNDQTVDFEVTQLRSLAGGGERVSGFGYRHLRSDMKGSFSMSLVPSVINEDLFSAFVQQSWRFLDQDLQLTLGSKFEQSSLAGFNVQPSVRASYRFDAATTLWGAVSRSVRTPSRMETDGRLMVDDQPGVPVSAFLQLEGDSSTDSEVMVAFEVGARRRFGESTSLDVTLFLQDYDDLIGVRTGGTPTLQLVPAPHVLLSWPFDNLYDAKVYGVELEANWKIIPSWRLRGSYSFAKMDGISGQQKVISQAPPEQTFGLYSYATVAPGWEFDADIRYNDRYSIYELDLDSWWDLNVRLSWQVTRGLELSLVGKDLLESEHFQFNDALSTESSSVGRTAFFKVDWHF